MPGLTHEIQVKGTGTEGPRQAARPLFFLFRLIPVPMNLLTGHFSGLHDPERKPTSTIR